MLDRLERLDTCGVADALDALGLAGTTIGIRPLWNCKKIVGRAMTVLVSSKVDLEPAQHVITTAIEASDSNTVLLIANEGDPHASCWDNIAANAATASGIRGVVIDGNCRNIDDNEKLGLPVYGRGVVPFTAYGRLVQKSFREPVKFAGVSVSADDYVIADKCGTVIIPAASADEVIDLAERLKKRELAIIAAVRSGRSVVEVMRDLQFNARI